MREMKGRGVPFKPHPHQMWHVFCIKSTKVLSFSVEFQEVRKIKQYQNLFRFGEKFVPKTYWYFSILNILYIVKDHSFFAKSQKCCQNFDFVFSEIHELFTQSLIPSSPKFFAQFSRIQGRFRNPQKIKSRKHFEKFWERRFLKRN